MSSVSTGMGDRRFVAQWGVLMQPKNRYRMTPGVRHSGIVNLLIIIIIISYIARGHPSSRSDSVDIYLRENLDV